MNSIEKALKILRVFTPDNRPLRSMEINHRLKMNKTTANRILIILKKRGFVVQEDRVVAAVAIIVPSFRMSSNIESISLGLLKETASEISERLSKFQSMTCRPSW